MNRRNISNYNIKKLEENLNAFLEAGIFLSIGKKPICLKNELILITVQFDLESYFYLTYKTLEQLKVNWDKIIPEFLNIIKSSYLN